MQRRCPLSRKANRRVHGKLTCAVVEQDAWADALTIGPASLPSSRAATPASGESFSVHAPCALIYYLRATT
jgi:hypothetical protein